ncbi:MAG: secondary thiamine-phosphate synthase enzyme YjbQ [Methanosarcina flavescens]|jgi:secondary thiamine-phosphate synthase enzyme
MTLQLKIKTSKRVELVDITSEVQEEVRKSEISEGICLISTQHTTAGIIINENETGLKEDILDLLNKLVPAGAGYRHDRIDDNADSHLRAILLGASESLPVSEGKLKLGTWQRIFFAEMDGPRTRTVNITLLRA